MKKSGFTLMELLVYMAIVGIIVMVAGQAFSDSTKFRVRTQNMLKADESVDVVSQLIKEDVGQMGAKSYLDGTTGKFAVDSDVLMPAEEGASITDKSSFNLTRRENGGNRYDSLTIRRLRYDSQGKKEAVEEVGWYVDKAILKRTCKVVSGADVEECTKEGTEIDIAENVTFLKIVPGVPDELSAGSVNTKLFPAADNDNFGLVSRFAEVETSEDGSRTVEYGRVVIQGDEKFNGIVGSAVTLYGFNTNYVEDASSSPSSFNAGQLFATKNAGVTDWKSCTEIEFEENQEYAIKFAVGYNDASRSIFVPGRDHATVGLRTLEGKKVPGVEDFLLYPPADVEGGYKTQILHFAPKKKEKACVAFTFANFSPMGRNLYVTISGLSVYKVVGSNYKFNDSDAMPNALSVEKKQTVRALQIEVGVNKNNEVSKTQFVVPVPSNGDKEAL